MDKRIERNNHESHRPKAKLIALSAVTVLALGLSASHLLDLRAFRKNFSGRLSQMMRLEQVHWEEVGSTNLSNRVSRDLLWGVSGLRIGQEMLPINLDELERKFAAVPWIESVQLQKKMPSTLLVKYTVHYARALAMRKRKPWTISAGGKWIAPFQSADASLDLPVLVQEDTLAQELNWLEILEKELGSQILQIHEINVSPTKMTALVDLRYSSQAVKVLLVASSKYRPESLDRLKRVAQYLIKNNILVSAIDSRPGKKVVVNVGKRP